MNATTNKLTNKPMNTNTYSLRKKVMNLVYDAHKLVTLPRITVRITNTDKDILGLARVGKNIIWISEEAIDSYDLRAVVYHEILHAVFSTCHDDSCPLMKSSSSTKNGLSKAEADKLFKKWACVTS